MRLKSNIYTPYQITAKIQHVTLILSICTVRLTNVLTWVRYQNTLAKSDSCSARRCRTWADTLKAVIQQRPVSGTNILRLPGICPLSWNPGLVLFQNHVHQSKLRNWHLSIRCPTRSITSLQTVQLHHPPSPSKNVWVWSKKFLGTRPLWNIIKNKVYFYAALVQ